MKNDENYVFSSDYIKVAGEYKNIILRNKG